MNIYHITNIEGIKAVPTQIKGDILEILVLPPGSSKKEFSVSITILCDVRGV